MTLEDEQFEYVLECPMCETEMELVIIDIDEKPLVCPMCGTEVEWENM
jgi:hypothetical protein